jgi:pimeloyl-ACP methyl ester carboxylesterase
MDSTFTASHHGGSGPPLLLLHGFTDTWRTWELVLGALEREHEVLALTLAGHAGGPAIEGEVTRDTLPDAVERTLDELGWEAPHVVGNSLGGYTALQLAARGRARTVVALAPAGGWALDDPGIEETLAHFTTTAELVRAAAPHADAIVATPEGRRRATLFTAERFEHIPPALLAHQLCGAAACVATEPLVALAEREGWQLDAEAIACPVRVVWGTSDRILCWPDAAARYRDEWVPSADWVVLDGVGHCPQLDVPLEAAQLILGFTARAASPARAG